MSLIDVDRGTPEYVAYLEALAYLTRLKTSQAPGEANSPYQPSDYWQEELSGFDYMLDASPLIVRKLRHHCYHITGLRVYDYRTGKKPGPLLERLNALQGAGKPELLVPENPALGGFGHDIDGNLYNTDTLKYYEVLLGLDQAGVLDQFRQPAPRRVVWEIGAGWGGFAYQFKTLFPNTTYIIADLPELFLFSYSYLKTVFPAARCVFAGGGIDTATALAQWPDADFIFVPNTETSAIVGVRPDLTINMVSFQEMTSEQVAEYVHKSADLGCPTLYSLNRDRSVYNEQMSNVRRLIRERYRTEDSSILSTDYVSGAKGKKAPTKTTGYQHIVGSLRESAGCAGSVEPKQPVAILGMVVQNGVHLDEALTTLRAQTREDFVLLVHDDSTTDSSAAMLAEHAAADRRILVHRVDVAVGSIAARQSLLARAAHDFPDCEYFAWARDRDRWDAEWLEALLSEMSTDPDCVLAYPGSVAVHDDGRLVKTHRTPAFDTLGLNDVRRRFGRVCHKLSQPARRAHGLFRRAALIRSGGLQALLEPERLLLLELALVGNFRQSPEVLWYERHGEPSAEELFGGEGPANPGIALHRQFARSFVDRHVKRVSPLGLGRVAALRLALTLYRTQKRSTAGTGHADRNGSPSADLKTRPAT